jgi:hypothetical protein
MMLAAGVKLGSDVDEIIPMIIDPDSSNASLTHTVTLMDDYSWIRDHINFPQNSENKFFNTLIDRYTQDYTLPIDTVNSQPFEQFIGLNSLNREDQAMVRMLFSEKNLKSSMNVGFKGNPNIGSVVLDEVLDSEVFSQFDVNFTPNDRIFIISSIFGGTGASGFPMLLKVLRNSKKFNNSQTINDATIGAVTVLPYFTVGTDQDGKSEINSATFASKTKSALQYYEDNVAQNGAIDHLYFVGDTQTQMYDYSVGGSSQNNAPHMVEFLAATSIIDFTRQELTDPSKPRRSLCYELGVDDPGGSSLSFMQFGPQLSKLKKPLTQFVLMANALNNSDYRKYMENQLAGTKQLTDFYDTDFFNRLSAFTREYREWLQALEDNNRSLKLFNLNCGDKPFNVVNGKSPETGFMEKIKGSGYGRLTSELNTAGNASQKVVKDSDPTYFLEMFYRATEKLVKDKFKF